MLHADTNDGVVLGGAWLLARVTAKGWWASRSMDGASSILAVDGDARTTWAVGYDRLVAARPGGVFQSRVKALGFKRATIDLRGVRVAEDGAVLLAGRVTIPQVGGWKHFMHGFVSRDGGDTFTPQKLDAPDDWNGFHLIPGAGPVHARLPGGIHRWEGGGWTPVHEPPNRVGLRWSFRTAMFGIVGDVLHRSLDGCVSFHPLALHIPAPGTVGYGERDVMVSSDDRGRVLVAVLPNFLARSLDNGETWTHDALPGEAGTQPIRAVLTAHGHDWIATRDEGWGTLWTTGPKPPRCPPDAIPYVDRNARSSG